MNIPMYGQVPYLQVLHMCKHDKFDIHKSLGTRLVSVDVSYEIKYLLSSRTQLLEGKFTWSMFQNECQFQRVLPHPVTLIVN